MRFFLPLEYGQKVKVNKSLHDESQQAGHPMALASCLWQPGPQGSGPEWGQPCFSAGGPEKSCPEVIGNEEVALG